MRARTLGIVVLVIAAVYGLYLLAYPTLYVRYRLSLDIEIDGKMQTSSGVVEIAYPIKSDFGFGEGSRFGGVFKGNAVTVDLGQRGLAFVVNQGSLSPGPKPERKAPPWRPQSTDLIRLPMVAYRLPIDGMPSQMENVVLQVQQKTHPVEVSIEKLPMIVHFTNIYDPHSNEEVDPSDFEASFGPGVRLVRATLEITRDPVTPIPPSWPNWLIESKTMGFLVEGRVGISFDLRAFRGEQ